MRALHFIAPGRWIRSAHTWRPRMIFDFSEAQNILQRTTRELLEDRAPLPRFDKDIPFQSIPTGRRDRSGWVQPCDS